MKISYNSLKKFISLSETPEHIADILSTSGLEVAKFYETVNSKSIFEGLVIAKVKEAQKHPNADKLKLLTVTTGRDDFQIVCGAPNVEAGQSVILATIGAKLSAFDNSEFIIKEATIRGAKSQGMVCSEFEIGIGEEKSGIVVLDDDFTVGDNLSDYISRFRDTIFEIEITPNRGDACSHLGVARDLSALLNIPFIDLKIKNNIQSEKLKFDVENLTPQNCQNFCLAYANNIVVKESTYLQKRLLKSLGIKPINNLVDQANLFMHDYGQPLHIYDANKLAAGSIKISLSEQTSSFEALDNSTKHLSKELLTISDNNGVIAIAGVIGGKDSSVTFDTTSILVECAYFSPQAVRNSVKNLSLNTQAAFRFERGVGFNQGEMISNFCSIMAIEHKISFSIHIDKSCKLDRRCSVKLTRSKLNKILGIDILPEKILEILINLGFEVVEVCEKGDFFTLLVPTIKSDVLREIDVIEEIVRIYGYDKIPETSQLKSSINTQIVISTDRSLTLNLIRTLLADGFFEIRTNPIISSSALAELNLILQDEIVSIVNPLSQNLDIMRPTMLPSLLQVASHNTNRGARDLRIFELGRIYFKQNCDFVEKNVIAGLITKNYLQDNWDKKDTNYTEFDLFYIIERLLVSVGRDDFSRNKLNDPLNEAFYYSVAGIDVAKITKINKKISLLHNLERDVFVFEIDIDKMFSLPKSSKIFRPISLYPQITRDISFWIDNEISYLEIKKIISNIFGDLLQSVQLIDIFVDKKLMSTKKSYMIRIAIQSINETLESDYVLSLMKNLELQLTNSLNAIIR